MLGLFAIGEYRGAAMEAHAVGSLGKTPDWPKIYSYYGNVAPYRSSCGPWKSTWQEPLGAGRTLPARLPVLDGRPPGRRQE